MVSLPQPEQSGYISPNEQLAYYRGLAAGQQAAAIVLASELQTSHQEKAELLEGVITRDSYIGRLEKENSDLGLERDALEIEGIQKVIHHRDQANHHKQRAERNPLTGLLNQEAFAEQVNKSLHSGKRRSDIPTPGTLFFVDLDHLGIWNDILSEPGVNKQILIPLAERLQSLVRSDDVLGHWGGDEFAIFAEGMSRKDAHAYAEKLRMAINAIPVVNPTRDGPKHLGVSTGYTEVSPEEDYTDAEIRAARAKKYAKAELGRNEIMDYLNVPTDYDFTKLSQKSLDALAK